jgi:[methyl-Co(III) methanol-specific corrinoid protein]:coenzyme M methyltransferase
MAALALSGHQIAGLKAVRYPLLPYRTCKDYKLRRKNRHKRHPALGPIPPFLKRPENPRVPENLLEKGRIPAVLKATGIPAGLTGNGTQNEIPLIAGMEGLLTVFSHLAEVKNYLSGH